MAMSFVAQSARGIGQPMVPQAEIDKAHTIVERFMIRWRGEPDPAHVKAVDAYFVSAAEHGMNASTFTARVIASTGADVAAALSGAVGAMSGPLHGGAPSRVLGMIEEVERTGDAAAYVKGVLDNGRAADGLRPPRLPRRGPARPRAAPYGHASSAPRATRSPRRWRRPRWPSCKERSPDRVLETNVEFWAAIVLDFAEVPAHMFTSMFTCARLAGWSAHILEQKRTGRLIRPSATLRRPGAAQARGRSPAGTPSWSRRPATPRSPAPRPSSPRLVGMPAPSDIVIPAALSPPTAGSAPARPRSAPAQVDALARRRRRPTSAPRTGRRPVQGAVGRVRAGLAELFSLPDGYEVVLGNGGATAFWDIATFGLIREQQPAPVVRRVRLEVRQGGRRTAPFLGDPTVITASRATHPWFAAEDGVDVYACPHNETSTGVADPRSRARRRRRRRRAGASSTRPPAPAACRSTRPQTDVYYFAPQKCVRLRRRAVARADVPGRDRARRARSRPRGRWVPAFLDLSTAIEQSRLDQTYNTPALATIFLMAEQIDWINAQGGLTGASSAPPSRAARLYAWAEKRRTRRRSSPTRRCARRSSAPSTSTTRSTRPRSRRRCGPTGSSTPSPTASSAATSCGSRCSRRSTRPTSRR